MRDFVGDLPDELLLCPVLALRVYLERASSISPRPRSLFVSPRAPSRPLSKNALSFFPCSVILQPLPPSTSSLPPSSSQSSSVRAHSIRGMVTSAAFSRNASLPFLKLKLGVPLLSTSFYLCDVQFSSVNGLSLGLVVAADTVL